MKDSKIDNFSSNYLSVHTHTTEYNRGKMNMRITEFERLWNRRLLPPARLERFAEQDNEFPRPALIRQTNLHHIFPEELEKRWWASSAEERQQIEFDFDIMRGDLFENYTPTPVPYYECDDDDDMRWIE